MKMIQEDKKLHNLYEVRFLLTDIDRNLQKLDKIDPYGDLLENFAEFPDKEPVVTKRLLKMIQNDIDNYILTKQNAL